MGNDKATVNDDIYLLIADETEGFQLALRYATHRAKRDNAHLAILCVMDKEDFQHWEGIQERIHEEHREEAQGLLLDAAQKSLEMGGDVPVFFLEEGGRHDVIAEVIQKDPCIRRMILGAEANSSNPGPLVSYFTGKGLQSLGVPLTIIPGNLSEEAMKGLF